MGKFHVQQNDEMDCGPACLATVAKVHGKRLSLARIRNSMGVTKAGASMLMMVQCAERLGFSARGMILNREALVSGPLPAIAMYRNHFVTVVEIKGERILVSDPAKADSAWMDWTEFESSWTRFAIQLEPGEAFHRLRDDPRGLVRYLRTLIRSGKHYAWTLMLSLLVLGLNLFIPVSLKALFDRLGPGLDSQVVLRGVAVILLVSLLSETVGWIRRRVLSVLVRDFNLNVSKMLMDRLLSLPYPYFSVRTSGEIYSRFSDLGQIQSYFTVSSFETLLGVISIFAYFIIFGMWSPGVVWFLSGVMLVSVLIFRLIRPSLVRLYIEVRRRRSIESSSILEIFSGIQTIRLNGLEEWMRWRWVGEFNRSCNANADFQRWNSGSEATFSLLRNLSTYGVALFGIAFLPSQMSRGEVVALLGMVGTFFGPLYSLLKLADEYNRVLVSSDRVSDILDTAPEAFGQERIPSGWSGFEREIAVRDVKFTYAATDWAPVLKEASFTVPKGSKVALVGASGSGKTTLLLLAAGVLKPDSGWITYDGVETRNIRLEDFRKRIGIVSHSLPVVQGTVLDNIVFSDAPVDRNRLDRAIENSNFAEVLQELPEGLETRVGAGGRQLSGGQRQRLVLARALYREPEILFLDEATSAMDLKSEAWIIERILRQKQMTVISSVHRISAIKEFDAIHVVGGGRIVESGTHEELMALGGSYRDLVRDQTQFGLRADSE